MARSINGLISFIAPARISHAARVRAYTFSLLVLPLLSPPALPAENRSASHTVDENIEGEYVFRDADP